MIDDPAGRADNDMHAAAQAAELRAIGLAAIDWQNAKTRNMRGVALECFGNLDRQFARWREYERLRLGLVQVELVQDRQGKRGGLAGAGLRLAEDVLAGQQVRNRLRLDW